VINQQVSFSGMLVLNSTKQCIVSILFYGFSFAFLGNTCHGQSDTLKSEEYLDFSNEDDNRQLWYKEIETPVKTKYTKEWFDNPFYFHADNEDFEHNYSRHDSIFFAVQIGPYGAMWSYKTVTCKKAGDRYQLVCTVFTHNRFRYKATALLDQNKFIGLSDIIDQGHQDYQNIVNANRDSSEVCERFYKYTSRRDRGVVINNINKTVYHFPTLHMDTNCPKERKFGTIFKNVNGYLEEDIEWKVTYEL